MLKDYKKHCEERKEQGIPPLPLSAQQTSDLVELLKSEHAESELLLELLKERIPAGVDQAAYVKAAFLADIAKGKVATPIIDKALATKLLGTMLGGYNIQPLISLLNDEDVGDIAVEALSNTLLIFELRSINQIRLFTSLNMVSPL